MAYDMKSQVEKKEENPHWLKTTFQVATIGGVAAGAVVLPYTGTGKATALKALKTTDDAMGRYLKRNKTPQLKIVIDAVRKAPKKMATYSKKIRQESKYVSNTIEPYEKIDQNLIRRKVEEEWLSRNNKEDVLALEQGRPRVLISRATIEEDLKNKHNNARNLGMGQSPFKESANNGAQNAQVPGKESKMNTLTTNAIAGIGLGAGITAYHAIDDRVSGNVDRKEKDRTFRAGGSWLGQEKKASLLGGANQKINEIGGNMHRAMKNKGAETLQNALIFNTAGLGFAKAIETTKNKARTESNEEGEGANKNGRIVIELPSQEAQSNVKKMNRNNPTNAMGGGFQQYAGTEKRASLADAAKKFGGNLLGRSDERRLLQKQVDGGIDLYKSNVGQRFGNHVQRGPEEVNQLAARAKSWDEESLRGIENEVGGARLKAGLGLAGAGILGSKAKESYKERQNDQQ